MGRCEPEDIGARLRNGLKSSPDGKQLACVILSLRDQPGLVPAVQSILAQDVPVEVVVVNSGGGAPARTLRSRGIEVEVIQRPERLYAGAARNLGIAATRAPFVSFLAADCLAEPGWARGRLRRHEAGALAVSSAVINASPRNLFAWTSYVLQYSDRMPDTPAHRCSHFGISYARTLFDHFGAFREDLRVREDTEFNERFRGLVPVQWAPDVRTAHRHPTTLPSLLGDQFGRGVRAARALEELTGIAHERRLAEYALKRAPISWRWSWEVARSGDRRYLAGAAVFLPPAVLAYSLGALLSGWRHPSRRATVWARRSAGPPQAPKVLALLQFRNEMRYLPGYFKNVPSQVDGVIALDDGSTDGSAEFVAAQPSVLELVRRPPAEPHVWNEPENRRLLIEAALRHHPDWLIAVDADERLERRFRTRARAEIERAGRKGYLAYSVWLRELWNRPDTYRVDGIWGTKRRARFFKARSDHSFDERDLHGQWAPVNSSVNGQYPAADLVIYHLKMIDEEDRRARQARYFRLDPDRRWQAIGYEYLTDERGLVLKRVPPRRGYE